MTRLPHFTVPGLVILMLGLCAPVLYGTPVTFTDRATWAATSTLSTVITFSEAGLTVPTGPLFTVNYNTAAGVTVGGLTFVGYSRESTAEYGLHRVAENATPNPFYDYDSGVALTSNQFVQADFLNRIRVNIPGGATSVGLDLANYFNSGGSLTVQLSTGDSFNLVTGTRPSLTFFGLTNEATSFTWVDIYSSTSDAGVLLDNVQFGTYQGEVGETPELTTVLYLVSGLVGIFMRFPRRKRS